MATKFVAVGSNLFVAYKEVKLFALLPQVYQQEFVDFLLYETTSEFRWRFP